MQHDEFHCALCHIAPTLLGKKFFLPLFGHRYQRISLDEVRKISDPLGITIIGGLARRGWTTNDIDVVYEPEDARTLDGLLKARSIMNPIHHCRTRSSHSCVRCIMNGIKLALTGRGY